MNLDQPSTENMKYILDTLSEELQIVNRSIMEVEDYNLDKYEDLKMMYEMVKSKGQLSAFEKQAFIQELSSIRK
ncbi:MULTISPECIES: DUF1128 domain-containing protein [Oceanobacillus]|uniref:UPF0435 protein MACH08_17470 n=1 Tax=Oceanobacillus kimchii TaxID=746691 RepID=A0ABQ5TGG9_9BACI|nr:MULTISPECIES: DUF1128 domain-containing protein [Oceanobacillus]MBT2598740.1 DUF1128 domain-containing protein [Oceanobacillus sp. ISL-74]MBT2651659.1 DUF1128 domain-containing protein [Oceanobacillus sp. ISL-73]MCT1576308.1 DUF1128 domain-containing protein [Oceanobacillus kimchii]MCT2135944.1 DUF1128 domain-containing protein [Oceanobacillus kimchii]OEH54631.1 hypothetical protein AQ616_12805 [Oceanobacillus sp. E9]